MPEKYKKRTLAQNAALHRYFELLAEALNEAGWDMKKTLKPGVEIPWTSAMVKTHLWKPIQKVLIEKESTTEMTTLDPSQVYQVLDRHLSEITGVHVEFPSEENNEKG